MHRRAEWFLAPLFFAALMAALYHDVWWNGKIGIGWDLIESYWPDLAFLANEFGRGNFPLWNPYERGGVAAHADPQPALFYPVQWLLASWGALRGEVSWGLIQFKELFHHVLTASLMHLFLRTRRLPWQAALFGGAVVILSGPWFLHKSNNFLFAVAWTPLVWIAIDALVAKPGAVRACALAAALYLPGSAGSPPGYFFVLLMVGAYGVWRVLVSLDRKEIARFGSSLLLAAGLTLATQLIIMLPIRDVLALSARGTRTVEFAVDGGCGLDLTLTSLCVSTSSFFIGATCGALALVLAVCAVVGGKGRDRGETLFFLGTGLSFLVLAAGSQTPVLAWLVVHAPGFGMFRVACRYILLFAMMMGPAAAHGVRVLIDPRTRVGPRLARIGFAIVAVMGVCAWIVSKQSAVAGDPSFPARPGLFLFASSAMVLAVLLLPRKWAGGVAAIFPLVILIDVAPLYFRDMAYHARPDNLEDRAKVAHLKGLDTHRIYDEFLLEQRAGSRLSLREFRGYTTSDPLTRADYGEVLKAGITWPGILGEYNIRYVFHGPHTLKGWGRKILSGPPDLMAPKKFRKLDPVIYEAIHPAPWAAWYGAIEIRPVAGVLPTLATARDDRGVRGFAVVSQGDLSAVGLNRRAAPLLRRHQKTPDLPGVPGKITRFETETIEVEIDAPFAGVVVLNEAHFPGWRVFVDGQEDVPFKVDLFLRGVLVPAGFHHIRWVYDPPHWNLLFGSWSAGMVAFLVAGVVAWRRRVHPKVQS